MIKEIRKLVMEAETRSNKKCVEASKANDEGLWSYWSGCSIAYGYVLKILDRFSDEKGVK